ncbi:MAG: HAD hydrolase-like protein [Rickettsiales bacterium]|nr:HAD hydrolase-like protein [Rickettsiales bacterium]
MKIVKPKAIVFDWNGTLVFNDKNNLIKLLPNAFKVVEKLNELDILVSVVSNTYINFLNRTIKKYQMQKCFLNVVGTRSNIEYKKPSKEVIDYALIGSEICDVNIDTVWMVGNSMQDVQTAYNANLRPIIFGDELLKQILHDEGLEKNKKAIYLKNHLDFLKILEELE